MTKHEKEKKELDWWRDRVRRAIDTLPSGELFTMWSVLFGTRKGKPKKSYWRTREAEVIVQRLLDMLGEAARTKSAETPVDLEEAIKIFGGDL